MTPSQLPVIFLAFANDHANYLYKLTEEQDAIRSALEEVEKLGLCQVVYETDTDLNKIWRTFQKYQDRISIFHYGGHAEDYVLMLKQASGEHQIAHAEGLVGFLAQQKSLKLVFLNGCSSRRQVEELRDKGIPAVIGTSQPINDNMATQLSGQFYQALAAGFSLEQAWQTASDYVRAQRGEKGYYRSLELEDGELVDHTPTIDFPWELYIRPGAEQVKSWNLAREAKNPLFNLPLPEKYYLSLRNSPFVGLHFFQEEDSALFFGRGVQIRELYNHLKGIHPIILLYGKSGVGKSSLLDAGLLPRIKGEFQSVYARRIQEKGLLGTLELALGELLEVEQAEVIRPVQEEELPPQPSELELHLRAALDQNPDPILREQLQQALQRLQPATPAKRTASIPRAELTSLLQHWQAIEQQTGKPLVIILDQVEEKFTRPMPVAGESDELLQFLTAVQPLFGEGETGIRGKLILSYRKEYHPEIRDTFQTLSLPYAELFLKRLDRAGIMEAIEGVNQSEITRRKYQLQAEETLPEIIADDLLEDSESPVAPVLQIILEKLWNTAWRGEHQPVHLTVPAYQELRKQGTTMEEFFQQQMEKLEATHPAEVASGLALDLLHSHTTNLGTAGSRKRADILAEYGVEATRLSSLIQQMQDLTLLVRIDQRQGSLGEADYTTILAHDTLTPIVVRAYNLSDAPGQRASRILSNKLADVGYRLTEEQMERLLAMQALQETEAAPSSREELAQEQIGPANFLSMLRTYLPEAQQSRLESEFLTEAIINLRPEGREIFLAEGDLLVVEEGVGLEGDQLPGLPKLSRAGQQLIALSRQKRAERVERDRRIARRQRIFTAAITLALIVATGLGIWAIRSANTAQTNLDNFQQAKADEVINTITDILEREATLRNKGYQKEADDLISEIQLILSEAGNQENRLVQAYADSLRSLTRIP